MEKDLAPSHEHIPCDEDARANDDGRMPSSEDGMPSYEGDTLRYEDDDMPSGEDDDMPCGNVDQLRGDADGAKATRGATTCTSRTPRAPQRAE